jgi:hypothetical protein
MTRIVADCGRITALPETCQKQGGGAKASVGLSGHAQIFSSLLFNLLSKYAILAGFSHYHSAFGRSGVNSFECFGFGCASKPTHSKPEISASFAERRR